MNKENNHITLKEIIHSLENEESRERIFAQLKITDPTDDEVKGVKLFLENNNYDYTLLKYFLHKSKPNFKTLLSVSRKTKTNRNWLKYAAVLIPLIGIGYFIKNSSSKNLYSKYYEKEVGLLVSMGSDTKIIFNNSMNAFKDDSFEEAINGFNKLLATNPSNDTLHYFLGCSYFEIGEIDHAEQSYLLIEDNSAFKQKRDFRLALLYIKKKEFESARKILLKIVDDRDHRYNTEAIKILQDPLFNN